MCVLLNGVLVSFAFKFVSIKSLREVGQVVFHSQALTSACVRPHLGRDRWLRDESELKFFSHWFSLSLHTASARETRRIAAVKKRLQLAVDLPTPVTISQLAGPLLLPVPVPGENMVCGCCGSVRLRGT